MIRLKTESDLVEALQKGAVITFWSWSPDEFDVDWEYRINGNVLDESDIEVEIIRKAFGIAEDNADSIFDIIEVNEHTQQLITTVRPYSGFEFGKPII